MNNHVHLVAVPRKEDSLSRAIGEAHRRYTRMVNSRQGVRGYLFQGRFFSCPLDDRYLLAAVRYVERNPVRAGLVKRAWEYPWSSARFHVGLRRRDCLVEDPDLLGLVDDWRSFLRSDDEDADRVRQRTRTGRPCGASAFVKRLERRTGRRLAPRRPGRPKRKRKQK
jgi:putative transposase